MTLEAIDLGHGVTIEFVQWAPDRELNPQYEGIPDIPRHGVLVNHSAHDGESCSGFVTFDSEVARRLEPNRPKWAVESWEPLTVSPSVLCRICGHHGFIREGRWIPA